MCRAIAILVTSLCVVAVSGASLAQEPAKRAGVRVFAYYYPWYEAGDWSRHGYAGTPVLGKYGTDSPKVAQQHIDWCARHHVDGLFVSWWGKDHLAARHLNAGLMKASNLDQIQFALFYESLGLLDDKDGAADGVVDFGKPKVMAALVADFRHLKRNYFGHASYWKISGRPVVGLYVTRTFKGFKADHARQLRDEIDADVYLIADEAFFGEQASPETARNAGDAFDAYTAYNMFENAKVRDGDTALTYQSREAFPVFRRWANRENFLPAIFPSYADFRGHKKLPGTPADFTTLLDAATTIAQRSDASGPPVVFVTSFNEWWEGTTIEPAREYGSEYLEAIRDR